jgi:hypothetical protein
MDFVKNIENFLKGILVEQDVSENVVDEQMVEKKNGGKQSSKPSPKTGTVIKIGDISNDSKKSGNE